MTFQVFVMTTPTTTLANEPLSFAHLGALDVGPPELLDLLAAAGFSSTSLRMMRTVPGSPQYDLPRPEERRAVKAAIQASGVSVLMMELLPLGPALRVPHLKAMFDSGADIGVSRVMVAGDDEDLSLVADKLAEVAALAESYRMVVDLEFMPFRPVRTIADAKTVLGKAGARNAYIVLDALHFFRSKGNFAELRATDPTLFSIFQICDAQATPPNDLTFEARNSRLLPGHGELDLQGLMSAMPRHLPIAVEVPLALSHPTMSPLERMRLSAVETRAFLSRIRRD